MATAFTTSRRVEFADTDMAGLIHFSCFYRYMEEVEHAFLRSLGRRVIETQDDGTTVSWPRVSAECSFHAPAHFEDELEVRLSVTRIGKSSLTLGYDFWKQEIQVASGSIKTVCCRIDDSHELTAIEIPADLRDVLQSAVVSE